MLYSILALSFSATSSSSNGAGVTIFGPFFTFCCDVMVSGCGASIDKFDNALEVEGSSCVLVESVVDIVEEDTESLLPLFRNNIMQNNLSIV